jgi:hypothetical protein
MSSWVVLEKYTRLLSESVHSLAACGLISHGFFAFIVNAVISRHRVFAGLTTLSYIIWLSEAFVARLHLFNL